MNLHLVPFLLVCLVAWRMYMRLRRNFGRQPLQPKRMVTRMVTRIVIFAVITCGLAVFSFIEPRLLIGLGAGLVVGLPLAWVGLKLTQFETTPQGRFYTPHSTIGILLTVLLVARLGYRVMVVFSAAHDPTQPPPLMQSALSFFVFALLASYYMAYYTGVLMRSRTAAT
jgi:cytochrome b561